MTTKALLFSASLLAGAYLIPVGLRPAIAQSDVSHAADNSAQNQPDRNRQTLTPVDQSNKPEDLTITRKIRQALVKNDHLSTEAKNIKIITIDGAVTLRGPVRTERERANIVAVAARFAGHAKVHNELEVAGR
jgi:hyperosmotically inducible periplasmic protein